MNATNDSPDDLMGESQLHLADSSQFAVVTTVVPTVSSASALDGASPRGKTSADIRSLDTDVVVPTVEVTVN